MKWAAIAALLLGAAAAPAFADLTIEYSGTINMLPMLEPGMAKLTTRIETRRDRSRTTRLMMDSKAPEGTPADTSIEIIREDKHVRWELDPRDRSYTEYPWPDTTLPVSAADIKAEMKSSVPDSVQRRMDAMEDQVTEVRSTGEHRTIHGFDAEHFVIESRMRNKPKDFPAGADFGALHEVWVAKSVPNYEEIKRRLDEVGKRSMLSEPSYDTEPKSRPDAGALPDYSDKIDGLPVHYIARMKWMDSTQVAEFAKARASAPDSVKGKDPLEEAFDPATGAMTMMDMEMTFLSTDPIDDSRFEVPAGYRRAEWQLQEIPKPKPTAKPRPVHHPPR